jgi:uncharacterized damage-inducible protein DinB
MNPATNYFALQYKLVQQSRKALFDYCRTLTSSDLVKENTSFGRGGSVRNLLVHIANTYQFWILKNALNKEVVFTEYGSKKTMDEIEHLFLELDRDMDEFFRARRNTMFETMTIPIAGRTMKLTAFELFTHVITHEFHHKGQVLSLSRHLGYVPVDTDVIR